MFLQNHDNLCQRLYTQNRCHTRYWTTESRQLRESPLKKLLIASAAALIISGQAQAATMELPLAKQIDKAQITRQLQKIVPNAKVDSISPSPVKGLYEVASGSNVFYTTKTGDYAIYGHLLDLKQQEPVSLTEQALKKFRAKAIADLDPKTTIDFSPKSGDVKQTITVFTDIDCAYCRKFHQELPALNKAGFKVRYVSFPRAGVNSESFNKAVAVWCADDQQEAMTRAKTGKSVTLKSGCDKSNVIRQHLQLVQDLDLRATPVLILEDGTEIPGYMPADNLIAKINASQTKNS